MRYSSTVISRLIPVIVVQSTIFPEKKMMKTGAGK
uniref:Uncharacterized protein n=1 Tax=Arundo donax TaxID=35708 RepID=A0A0A9B269_ARUDO